MHEHLNIQALHKNIDSLLSKVVAALLNTLFRTFCYKKCPLLCKN